MRHYLTDKMPTEEVQHLHFNSRPQSCSCILRHVKYSTLCISQRPFSSTFTTHSIRDNFTPSSCRSCKSKRKRPWPPNPSHFLASPAERWRLHLYAHTRVRVGLSTRRCGVFPLSSRKSFSFRSGLSQIRRARPPRTR